MKPPGPPLFLARRTYRRRRLIDSVRLVPILGLLLFLMPVLWAGDGTAGTAGGAIYLFIVWAGLIALAFGLSRALARASEERETVLAAGRGGGAARLGSDISPDLGPDLGPDIGSNLGAGTAPSTAPSTGPSTGQIQSPGADEGRAR